MRRISLLVVLPTLLAPFALAPSAPAAGKGCDIETIIAQAYQNATVSDGYSVSCLRKAQIAAANDADIATYSDVDQVLRAAIVKAGGTPKPIPQTPTAPETQPGRTGDADTTSTPATTERTPTKTVTRSPQALVDKPEGDGGGVPTPVIALGVVALAAVVAAALVELRRRRASP
jgi:hypothetical protein